MSSVEKSSVAPESHPATGGKSLAALSRPRYKSWRKKYRKMRHEFELVLDENKRFYKEEQKLEGIARRLREDLDSIMEICLDLNQQPALPPRLRFNISHPSGSATDHTTLAQMQSLIPDGHVPAGIEPQEADNILTQCLAALQAGQVPPADLLIWRGKIEAALAAQGTVTLDELEEKVQQPVVNTYEELPMELKGDQLPGYLSTAQEEIMLLRMDASAYAIAANDPLLPTLTKRERQKQEAAVAAEETLHKHPADLTAREWDRQIEWSNPQSQHNWLKVHAKQTGGRNDNVAIIGGVDMEDGEVGFISEGGKTTPSRGGGGASGGPGTGKRSLAKTLADKSLDRARGDASPGRFGDSGMGDDDDGSMIMDDVPPQPGSGKRRTKKEKDEDAPYRAKAPKGTGGGGSGGGGTKSKRKRSGEDIFVGKKAKIEPLD